jgi:hypothetical protein
MMASIAELADLATLLLETVPNQLARETGCLQRHGKFDGATLVSTLVLGFWSKPEATLSQLTHMAAVCGVQVSPQGLDQRFTPQLAELLRQVLATAVGQTVTGQEVGLPLLARFNGVYIQDCSTVSLPRALRAVWQGCGGKAGVGESAIKLGVQLDLLHGQLDGPHLASGRTHDRVVCAAMADLPPASLWMGDLGLVTLARLRTIAASGGSFLSRLKSQTRLETADGRVWSQLELLAAGDGTTTDVPVRIGSRMRLPVRLLAIRMPAEIAEERRERLRATAARKQQPVSAERLALAGWSIYVTNATVAQLSLAEAAVLVRARWQIELLFKLWKQHARIDASRSRQPQRLLCELYAKLIGVVLQHWLVVQAAWHEAARSLVQLADIVRSHVVSLASGRPHRTQFIHALTTLHRCLQHGCRINHRATHPNTHQLLANPALGGLA